ncbi:hypothetical protein DYB25_005575 [Aphanomyces astaci]|uniref:Uncharacterized protein n=1 Tax=Aphanomyces astaci TaxID=112090 RepID=A0A397AV92_APHAT|nr:hypothetical protein DYB25_005575 [Aphanomyces astaci]
MKPLRPVQRALLVDFLYREVFGIIDIKESDGPHNQQRVVDFFKSFVEMEKLVIYGLVLCVDSFLYVFTYLPLRIILALGSAVVSVFYTRIFRRSHVHDLLTAVIVILSTGVLMQVDMSRVYHLIRNQALIKLYVLFTMLEIFDKLFSSLGQDVLDAMYFTVRYQPRRVGRMMFDFAVSSSLMTLLISNNFAELKHAFISKFNQIPPSVYSKFLTVLCRDVSGYRSDTTFLDHSQFVSRRLGLISLPLACVVLRMLFKALRDFDLWSQLYTPSGMSIALLGFANLSAFKVLLSLWLMVHSTTSGRLSPQWKASSPAKKEGPKDEGYERLHSNLVFTT